jgi:hypothetical protein
MDLELADLAERSLIQVFERRKVDGAPGLASRRSLGAVHDAE